MGRSEPQRPASDLVHRQGELVLDAHAFGVELRGRRRGSTSLLMLSDFCIDALECDVCSFYARMRIDKETRRRPGLPFRLVLEKSYRSPAVRNFLDVLSEREIGW